MNYLLLGGCWIALVLYGFTKSALALSVGRHSVRRIDRHVHHYVGVNLYYERRG